MKSKFSLPKYVGPKNRKIAKPNSSAHLFEDDYKIILSLCKAETVTESEALRLIVSDWLRGKRVEALGKDHVEDPIRRIYERVISEQLAPLIESIRKLKLLLEKVSNNGSQEARPPTSLSGERDSNTQDAISSLRQILEQTGSDLAESAAAQMGQLELIRKSQLAIQNVANETFASSWTIADLLIRYIVEVNLRDQNRSPSEVESEVAIERRGLRLEGLSKIAILEEYFGLPKELCLAQLALTAKSFPMDPASQVQSIF